MKTQAEYVEGQGLNCPKCDSYQIEGREITVCAEQGMTCLECDAEWINIFELSGFQMKG